MEKLRNTLHKLLFPKEHRMIQRALNISWAYWHKSPSYSKQEVGEDIYMSILKSNNPSKLSKCTCPPAIIVVEIEEGVYICTRCNKPTRFDINEDKCICTAKADQKGNGITSVSWLGEKHYEDCPLFSPTQEEKCHDCQVNIGVTHRPGCDWEECPFCGGQLISCDCCYEKLGIDSEKEPVYSEGLNFEQDTQWEELLKEKGYIKFGDEKRFSPHKSPEELETEFDAFALFKCQLKNLSRWGSLIQGDKDRFEREITQLVRCVDIIKKSSKEFNDLLLSKKDERLVGIIKKLKVDKPNSKQEESIYDIKSAWLEETKEALLSILNSPSKE